MIYRAENWYWLVGGDATKVWSSRKAGFVDAADADYLAFVSAGGYPSPIASLAELRDVLAQQFPPGMLSTYAPAKRFEVETGGITVAGVRIATDDRSKQMIMGARVAADADPGFTTEWAGVDGNIYSLNAAQISAISNAVLAHVRGCFAIYATVMAAIDTGAITTTAQIDDAFAAG